MRKITIPGVAFEGLLPVVVNRLSQWEPGNLGKEINFRNDLYKQLIEALPDSASAEKEYRNLGTTIDIWIKWSGIFFDAELALELKVNLLRKTDYDRLIGQIESMDPEKTQIVIVLIGQTSDAFFTKLRHRYEARISSGFNQEPTMAIVRIPTPTAV